MSMESSPTVHPAVKDVGYELVATKMTGGSAVCGGAASTTDVMALKAGRDPVDGFRRQIVTTRCERHFA